MTRNLNEPNELTLYEILYKDIFRDLHTSAIGKIIAKSGNNYNVRLFNRSQEGRTISTINITCKVISSKNLQSGFYHSYEVGDDVFVVFTSSNYNDFHKGLSMTVINVSENIKRNELGNGYILGKVEQTFTDPEKVGFFYQDTEATIDKTEQKILLKNQTDNANQILQEIRTLNNTLNANLKQLAEAVKVATTVDGKALSPATIAQVTAVSIACDALTTNNTALAVKIDSLFKS